MNTLLSQLLSFSLFGGANPVATLPQPLSEDEWQQLFDASRRQAVTALLYDAVLLLPKDQRPPRRVLFHFTSMSQTIERSNSQRQTALAHLAAMVLHHLALPLVVVKGSSLARHYPAPLHRECGDNDLYTGADTERLCALMESMHIAVNRNDRRHASFMFEGKSFECHNYLLYHDDDPQWDCSGRFTVLDTPLHALSAEHEAFFLAKHIEHHAVFFHEPVRLRDVVDWSILICSEGFDFDRLRHLAKATDVECFVELLTQYGASLFGDSILKTAGTYESRGLSNRDFERIYMECPQRHRWALVRVVRRAGKYLRFRRQYRVLYGQSMFRRFYLHNLWVAVEQRLRKKENC